MVREVGFDQLQVAAKKRKRSDTDRGAKKKRSENIPAPTSSDQVHSRRSVRSPDQTAVPQEPPPPSSAQQELPRTPPPRPDDLDDRVTIHKEFRMTDSARKDPLVADQLLESILLPSDKIDYRTNQIFKVYGESCTGIFQLAANLSCMRDYILSFDAAKKDMSKQLHEVQEEAKIAINLVKSVEAKYAELKVSSSVEISTMKSKLLDSDKEIDILRTSIQKLREEKKGWEKEREDLKGKIIEEYRDSDQFAEDVADQSLSIFYQGFEDCKKKVKELLPEFDASLLISTLGPQEEVVDLTTEEGAREEEHDTIPDRSTPVQETGEETGGPSEPTTEQPAQV